MYLERSKGVCKMTAPQSVLRRYITRYHPRSGELLVYGGFAAGCFAAFLIYMTGNPFFIPGVILGLLSAFYYHPFLDTDSAQIGVDTRGIYIRKLGHLPWAAISAFRVRRIAVRSVERVSLQIKLSDDWQSHIQCKTDIPFTEAYSYKCWKKRKDNILEVRLEHMQERPNQIEKSILEIWQNRPVSSKEI